MREAPPDRRLATRTLACTFGAALATLLAVAGCSSSGSGGAPSSAPARHSSSPAPSPTHTHTKPPPTPAQLRSAARARIASIDRGQPAHSFSVAAVNLKTGAHFTDGATHGMWTASCYKLFILETLLLQHQHGGSELSSGDVSEATTMIENSDNAAGYDLFLAVGSNSGLEAAEGQLGMRHTIPGRSDPTFTRTSATDYISLLHNLVSKHGPLNSYSRSFTLHLMQNVETDQRWGVGVVADKGDDFANKNGWLSIDDDNGPGEQDNGLWAVNSVGVVRVHGQQVLMAVFSQHRPDFDSGIRFIQSLARAIKPAIAR